MYKKIQPLLENLHRNFMETRNTIGEQSREGRAGQWGVPGPCLPAPQSYPGQMAPWFLGVALNSGILQPNPVSPRTISPRDSSMPSGTFPQVHAVPAALSSSLPSGLELGWISVGRDRWSRGGDGGIPGGGYGLVQDLEVGPKPGSSGCGAGQRLPGHCCFYNLLPRVPWVLPSRGRNSFRTPLLEVIWFHLPVLSPT